jgi:hypothetical protein
MATISTKIWFLCLSQVTLASPVPGVTFDYTCLNLFCLADVRTNNSKSLLRKLGYIMLKTKVTGTNSWNTKTEMVCGLYHGQ